MDKIKDALPAIQKLAELFGVLIVLPLMLGAIIWYILRNINSKLDQDLANDQNIAGLLKSQADVQKGIADDFKEFKKDILEKYHRMAVAIAEFNARKGARPNKDPLTPRDGAGE